MDLIFITLCAYTWKMQEPVFNVFLNVKKTVFKLFCIYVLNVTGQLYFILLPSIGLILGQHYYETDTCSYFQWNVLFCISICIN